MSHKGLDKMNETVFMASEMQYTLPARLPALWQIWLCDSAEIAFYFIYH